MFQKPQYLHLVMHLSASSRQIRLSTAFAAWWR